MTKYLRVFLMMLALTAWTGCSNGDDGPESTFEPLVITSAELPESFRLGELYQIPITYQLPDGCTEFHTLSMGTPSQNERDVLAIGRRVDADGCTLQVREGTETLIFQVLFDQTYIFRFWQGENADGEPQFLEIEVPVVE